MQIIKKYNPQRCQNRKIELIENLIEIYSHTHTPKSVAITDDGQSHEFA